MHWPCIWKIQLEKNLELRLRPKPASFTIGPRNIYLMDLSFARCSKGHEENIQSLFDSWMREVQNAFCKRNYWMWTYWITLWITLYLSAGISWGKGQKAEFFFLNRQSRGWQLRPFPGVLLCPLNIPKITIFHGTITEHPGTITEHSKKYDSAWDWLQSPSEHLLYLQHPTYAKCLPFLRKLPFWSRNNYFCSPDFLLLRAFETNSCSCLTIETAFFAEHSFQAVSFLCNGVFFIIITNKKFASSDKGKKIALPDVAGIIVLLFFGSMGKGLSMGKQSIRKTCRCPVMRHPLLQNTWTSGIGPTLPLLNKHNMCQYTVPSHKKLYAWLWSGHLSILYTMPESSHLRKPGRDMWYQYQMIWWTQNLNLHPGTLVRPTS